MRHWLRGKFAKDYEFDLKIIEVAHEKKKWLIFCRNLIVFLSFQNGLLVWKWIAEYETLFWYNLVLI